MMKLVISHDYASSILPVRMFWNAVSTLVESSAEVSINDKPCVSKNSNRLY